MSNGEMDKRTMDETRKTFKGFTKRSLIDRDLELFAQRRWQLGCSSLSA
jgi:hypothetical protein